MQRYIRGLMIAGVAVVAWGCTDNPIDDGAGDPVKLIASPTNMFLNAGASKPMVVELVNDQNAALATTFTIGNVDAGISVDVDETFNPVYDADGNLLQPTSPTRVRLVVTGGADPGVYTFDVTASGVSNTFTVRVLPLLVTGAFSSATPACNEPVTYTVGAPFSFLGSASVALAGGASAGNVSIGGDALSMTFTTVPGFDGAATFSNMQLDFLPGVPVTFTSEETFAVGTSCFTGQDAFATAPAIADPVDLDVPVTTFDVGTIGTDQWYIFDVTDAGDYDVFLNWEGSADVDLVLYDYNTLGLVASAGTLAHPEHLTATLAPGTYLVRSNLYSGAAPAWIEITLIRLPASGS